MEPTTWTELVKPIVDQFRLAGTMGMEHVESPEGCAAMAKLLTEMAAKLDDAAKARRILSGIITRRP